MAKISRLSCLAAVLAWSSQMPGVQSWAPSLKSTTAFRSRTTTTRLFYNHDDKQEFHFQDDDWKLLQERVQKVHLDVWEQSMKRPPNANMTPEHLVKEILNGLWQHYDPLPDAGFRLLLQTATKEWRQELLHSIGAKNNNDNNWELVASALGTAMGRPHNQFAILVPEDDDNDFQAAYDLDIAESSTLMDEDLGTCWVDCRLRDPTTGELWVIMGWSFTQREEDGAWMVDHIDWQDFRDEFRPGIGREEWVRVCD